MDKSEVIQEIHQDDFNKLVVITLFMDIIFVYVLYTRPLFTIDYIFCISVLVVHFIFLGSLYYNYTPLLYILHYLIFILLTLGIFVEDIYILSICLFLSFMIQVLWIIEGRCILNKRECGDGDVFGFGNELNIFMLIMLICFSFKIGTKIKVDEFMVNFNVN